MNYDRFKELWNALVTNRRSVPAGNGTHGAVDLHNGMSETTSKALIAYADGERAAFDEVALLLES